MTCLLLLLIFSSFVFNCLVQIFKIFCKFLALSGLKTISSTNAPSDIYTFCKFMQETCIFLDPLVQFSMSFVCVIDRMGLRPPSCFNPLIVVNSSDYSKSNAIYTIYPCFKLFFIYLFQYEAMILSAFSWSKSTLYRV